MDLIPITKIKISKADWLSQAIKYEENYREPLQEEYEYWESIKEKKELASKMGHSYHTQQEIYVKYISDI